MNTYVWKSWSGGKCRVEADRVAFESGHVVFWNYGASLLFDNERLVLAVGNTDVHDLKIEDEA